MTPVLISSLLLIFSFSPRVESDIHSILRELDSSDLEENNNDTEKLNEYRKTLIKQEILNRLGLSTPPNISNSSFIPTQIIENILLQRKGEEERITNDVEEYYGVTKQVVVMAEPDKQKKMPLDKSNETEGTQVLRFRVTFPVKSISSMLLGFHRDPRVLSKEILKKDGVLSFRIFYNGHAESVYRPAQITKTDRNWVVFNITKESLNTVDVEDNSVKNISIQILCNICRNETFIWNSDNQLPFLIIDVIPSSRKRITRSSKCNGNDKRCCLVDYEVKFSDLGWSNWIIGPDSIYFNYCKGTCSGLGLLRQPHTLLVQRLLLKKVENKKSPYQEPCCVVTKMSGVTLFFRTGPNPYDIAQKFIPNMRAVECTCS